MEGSTHRSNPLIEVRKVNGSPVQGKWDHEMVWDPVSRVGCQCNLELVQVQGRCPVPFPHSSLVHSLTLVSTCVEDGYVKDGSLKQCTVSVVFLDHYKINTLVQGPYPLFM